jgi:hypothetical protein
MLRTHHVYDWQFDMEAHEALPSREEKSANIRDR